MTNERAICITIVSDYFLLLASEALVLVYLYKCIGSTAWATLHVCMTLPDTNIHTYLYCTHTRTYIENKKHNDTLTCHFLSPQCLLVHLKIARLNLLGGLGKCWVYLLKKFTSHTHYQKHANPRHIARRPQLDKEVHSYPTTIANPGQELIND